MELKQRDLLRETYKSNLILFGYKTYNLYITWLVPRDSKVKRILSSDYLPERERAFLVRWKFPAQPRSLYPCPKGFSWNFSSRKREQAAKWRQRVAKRRREREKRFSLSPCRFAARSLFREEKFQEKPLGPGYVPRLFTYEETNQRTRFFFRFGPGRKSSLGRIINPLLIMFVRWRWLDIATLFSSSSLSIKTQKRSWPIGSLNDARQPEMTPFPFKFALTLPNLYC